MSQKKNGSGALFNNDRKKESKHPDLKGNLIGLDGTEYFISGWNKTDRQGNGYISLAIQEKNKQ